RRHPPPVRTTHRHPPPRGRVICMTDGLIAVTGATGGVGGRVARRLADAGQWQRLLVRDLGRAPRLAGAEVARASYDDPAAMRRALRGVHTLFLVSAHEHPDRVGLHTGTVDAAVDAGVERIVYLSFLGAAPGATFTFARDHFHTEEPLRATGVPFTLLRDSLYRGGLRARARREGAARGPGGPGRFGPVARDDAADVAGAGRARDGRAGRTYDVTGPRLLSMAEVAGLIGQAA